TTLFRSSTATSRNSGSALTSRMRRSSGDTQRERGPLRAGRASAAAASDAGRPKPDDGSASALLVTVADAIQGFDLVETIVHAAELLANALHVAVDRAVVDIDILAIGGVDELVAAFHHAGPRRQRLHQQELGDRELDVLAAPGALVLGVVQHQLAAQ